MYLLETNIKINASLQTVWSILDDLEHYPEWNEIVPNMSGRTIVGERLDGTLAIPTTPARPLKPTITKIVGVRELRWISTAPNPDEFSAEHIFILKPTEDGGCDLHHNEIFKGTALEARLEYLKTTVRGAYNDVFNVALKTRAEAMKDAQVKLHPAVDKGVPASAGSFKGATLRCACASAPVEVSLSEPCAHNHLCGCSKCWKPEDALFAQVAVVPAGTARVTANENKLVPVDPAQSIVRHACKACGTHMVGRVANKEHHFYGLDFIHPELSKDAGWPAPEFAAFVSSIIETGATPSHMQAVRAKFKKLGLPAYDAFSPELMDVIAWHKVKLAKYPR